MLLIWSTSEQWKAQSTLVQLVPLPHSRWNSTCYSDRLQDFSVASYFWQSTFKEFILSILIDLVPIFLKCIRPLLSLLPVKKNKVTPFSCKNLSFQLTVDGRMFEKCVDRKVPLFLMQYQNQDFVFRGTSLRFQARLRLRSRVFEKWSVSEAYSKPSQRSKI